MLWSLGVACGPWASADVQRGFALQIHRRKFAKQLDKGEGGTERDDRIGSRDTPVRPLNGCCKSDGE